MISILADSVDGVSIANQIRLERAVHAGSFLLVEGCGDAKIFERFCDKDECAVVVCLGKPKLIDAINELNASNFRGALGFADRDFCEILGYPDVQGDVVYSDENDMEVTILCSATLDRVLQEFGSSAAIEKSIRIRSKTMRESIFSSASTLGALRIAAQENDWYLRFKDMDYKFKPNNSFIIDEKQSIRHILGRSHWPAGLTERDLELTLRALHGKGMDAKDLCAGHDCVRILGQGLKKEFGNSNQFSNKEGAKLLEGILRIAYEMNDFRSTKSFNAIRSWEDKWGFMVFG